MICRIPVLLAGLSLVGTGLLRFSPAPPETTSNPLPLAMNSSQFRPPAVPLVLHDPYFSIWSPADAATDAETVHWTGATNALRIQAVIDGSQFRLLGAEPKNVPALKQTSLRVDPTQTVYEFAGGGVRLRLTFLTPAIPDDLDLLARPATYVIWSVESEDGREHRIQFRMQASAEIAAGNPDPEVATETGTAKGVQFAKVGTKRQAVLGHRGDWIRIDWGHLYLALPADQPGRVTASGGPAASSAWLTATLDEVTVGAKPIERWATIAYDDVQAIKYFGQPLQAWWKRGGQTTEQMLEAVTRDFAKIRARCAAFDRELLADLTKVGGEKFAALAALAYRQCLGANKLVADPAGRPLLFPKENSSNGCLATADVVYPMAPQFFLLSPALSRAMLVPLLDYAQSSRWKFPFAPHDLGQYPKANGQVYGGGEKTEENQMPVEESANLLILVAALAKAEGNPEFARPYWATLTKWAQYLRAKGFDPENQLCTDDFLGHQAHNVNLSAKAIVGLACYSQLAKALGHTEAASEYRKVAEEFAAKWIRESDDGTHSRQAFDKPGGWSQKYNLVWDRILGLNVFPDEVREREVAHYLRVRNPFGLPLDSRGTGAKLDWSVWSATLSGRRADFEAILEGVYRFVDETPQRVGMGDWYDTSNGNLNFFQARSVVGGLFLPLLYDEAIWKKWASRDPSRPTGWAPIPPPPVVTPLVPAADTGASTWRMTMTAPEEDWFGPGFDDSKWTASRSGFGSPGTPGAVIGTEWKTKDIWIRREFELTGDSFENVQLWIHHDNNAEIYLNGVLACRLTGWTTDYEPREIATEARRALRAGRNVIAIHCNQETGGQYIDAGLVRVTPGR